MVGRRIDDILAEKANSKNTTGNCCLSPFVIPVVSSFKRLYKTRLSRHAVFKGKPLHTIDESNELAQNELNILNSERNEENSSIGESLDSFEEQDSLLCEIRNLFLQSQQHDNICDEDYDNSDSNNEECRVKNEAQKDFKQQIDYNGGLDSFSDCLSPSFSLIQQFEMAAKEEAAIKLQCWYKKLRDRRRFLEIRKSIVLIQRCFKAWQKQKR